MSSCVQCIICTDLMTDQCILLYLECGHVYHRECFIPWLNTSVRKTCPECRAEIKSPPRRLYLHFTNDSDAKDSRGNILHKDDSPETTITTLKQEMAKTDGNLRFTLAKLNQSMNANVRFKLTVSQLENNNKVVAAKNILLTQQLNVQSQQRQSLETVVKLLRINENTLIEKLQENRTIVNRLKETIHTMEKVQADQIIEKYQLELNRSELSTRLDQFRTEFVRVNNELQKMKSDNENLRHEVTFQKAEKQNTIELNVELEKTKEALVTAETENVTMKMAIDEIETKIRNDQASLKTTNITSPRNGNDGKFHAKIIQLREPMPKRKNEEMIIDAARDTKCQKLMESHSDGNYINKITILKLASGWTVVPK